MRKNNLENEITLIDNRTITRKDLKKQLTTDPGALKQDLIDSYYTILIELLERKRAVKKHYLLYDEVHRLSLSPDSFSAVMRNMHFYRDQLTYLKKRIKDVQYDLMDLGALDDVFCTYKYYTWHELLLAYLDFEFYFSYSFSDEAKNMLNSFRTDEGILDHEAVLETIKRLRD